jgi:hypothetical protein
MSAHGTHIASMILGRHGSAVRGIAPLCQGVIAPVFSDSGPGRTSQLDVARAINQAVQDGANIINISGGELSSAGEADPILASAVRYGSGQGAIIIAATGNDSCRCLHVPAALPSVLAVGAMDAGGLPLESSNWGDFYQTNGVLAPGQNMVGAVPGGGTALKTGSSFAAPVVTGIVALLLSLQLKRGFDLDPGAVREAILASAIPCDEGQFADCRRFLAGRLNIPGAYALISQARRTPMSDDSASSEMANPTGSGQLGPVFISGLSGQEGNGKTPGLLTETNGPTGVAPQAVPDQPATPLVAAPVAPPRAPDSGVLSSPISAVAKAWNSTAAPALKASSVEPSDCSCQTNGTKSLVFAIGVLGFDFGCDACRDGFKQVMPHVTADGNPFIGGPGQPAPPTPPFLPNPYDPRQMVNYLAGFPPPPPDSDFPTQGGFPNVTFPPGSRPLFPQPDPYPRPDAPRFPAHLSDAADLIWTLNIELTPIYSIRPAGTFSTEAYQRLVEFLAGQIRDPEDPDYVSRVSIPGVLTGQSVRLFSGQVVPVIEPRVRWMFAWHEKALTDLVLERMALARGSAEGDTTADALRNYLDRIYYDLRNLGQTPAERALNFSATNAFQAGEIFLKTAKLKYFLDTITVERSAFCRKDSDCWDVKLVFFDPNNVLRSRKLFRFTVDVSAEYPVTIGPVREWDVAPGY